MRIPIIFLVLGWLFAGIVSAGDGAPADLDRLQRENDTLKLRVAKLETEMAEIRSLLGKTGPPAAAPGASPPVDTSAPPPPAPPAGVASSAPSPPPPAPEGDTPSLPAPPPVSFYGFVELDLTKDFDRNILGIPPESENEFDNQTFDCSPKPTRLGARFQGPTVAGGQTTGRVEVDFNSSSGGATSPNLRMRHAYFQMDWPGSGLSLLAGQTWDVIAPLQTDTISYPVESWTGDLGYRRPQVRLTKRFAFGQKSALTFQGALARTTNQVENFPGDPNAYEIQVPMFQARASVDVPVSGGDVSTFGFYGHWGSTSYKLSAAGDQVAVRSWSLGLDAQVAFLRKFLLMVEFWRGVTMDTYYWEPDSDPLASGDQASQQGILANGGWWTLTYKATDKLRFNVGMGQDKPLDRVLDSEARTRDISWFGNFFYDFVKNWEVGLEFSYWQTDSADGSIQSKRRSQATLMYFF